MLLFEREPKWEYMHLQPTQIQAFDTLLISFAGGNYNLRSVSNEQNMKSHFENTQLEFIIYLNQLFEYSHERNLDSGHWAASNGFL